MWNCTKQCTLKETESAQASGTNGELVSQVDMQIEEKDPIDSSRTWGALEQGWHLHADVL